MIGGRYPKEKARSRNLVRRLLRAGVGGRVRYRVNPGAGPSEFKVIRVEADWIIATMDGSRVRIARTVGKKNRYSAEELDAHVEREYAKIEAEWRANNEEPLPEE